MKKALLISALLIICFSAKSQITTIAKTEKEAMVIADSIATYARNFTLSSNEYVNDSTIYKATYICTTDSTNKLYVFFNKRMKGQNKDLEIVGTPELKLSRVIASKYLDLFPLWKAKIDINADIEKCVNAYNQKQINGTRYYFKKTAEWWELSTI